MLAGVKKGSFVNVLTDVSSGDRAMSYAGEVISQGKEWLKLKAFWYKEVKAEGGTVVDRVKECESVLFIRIDRIVAINKKKG